MIYSHRRLSENESLLDLAEKFREKLEPIKLVLLDVDGILTTGHIYYAGEEVGFNRYFHVSDGYILRVLMKHGLQVGIVSAGHSLGVIKRIEDLKIPLQFLGSEDKREAFTEALRRTNLKAHEVLYMGDEFFDMPLLKKAGFSATTPHASYEVQEVADYVTFRGAGQGAVREVIDMLRYVQKIVPLVEDF